MEQKEAIRKQVALVVSDLDGTLLDSNKEVSEANRKAIQSLKDHGILFGVITGRPVESCEALNEKEWRLGNSLSVLSGVNGGVIYDCRTRKKEQYGLIDGWRLWDVMQHFRDFPDLHFEIMVGSTQYVEFSTPETEAIARQFAQKQVVVEDMEEFLKTRQVDKLIIRSKPEDQKAVMERAKTFHPENLVCFPTSNVLFEYCHPGINKGFGLKKVCEHYGISPENVVAFGDEGNDLEMLQEAGVGVAVKNATAPVKQAADVVSDYTNNEDALARYLIELLSPRQKDGCLNSVLSAMKDF